MNNLHTKLKEYRDIRDNRDDQIRARVREHVDEIAYLRDCKKTLESQLQVQTELVKITGIDRSTLADLVARLMAQGYLQRRRTKEDARANAIRLTPVGKKILKSTQHGAEEIDKRLLASFSVADRRVTVECLGVLASEMDKVDVGQVETEPPKIRLRKKA